MRQPDADADATHRPTRTRHTQAERRDRTKGRLLEAAVLLFSEHGYHRTQVMDIVNRARVSAGTFYRYFDDKQGIFFAIAEELSCHEVEEARKARQMVLEAADFPAAVRTMVHYLERHFERVVDRAPLYRALMNSGVVDRGRDHAWAMKEKAVCALAEQLGAAGPRDTDDLQSLARMVMGAISELRYAMIHSGKPSPADAARLATRFLQGGLTAYSTRAPRYTELHDDSWRRALDDEAPV
ncbi:MAG: TetR/AcrR family transcriptional regulator [Myxococcales bacterium]|nr:TetR/AcrR family transcriptional regulator [Myxococcales bacterium]